MPKELTNRLKCFVDLLPEHKWIALQAGQAAGFSYNYSKHRLPGLMLSNVVLKQAIEDKRAELAAKIDVTVEFIIEKLLIGLTMAETKGDLVALARFSELLGRYKAMFTDNVKQTGEGLAISVTERPAQQAGLKLVKPAG